MSNNLFDEIQSYSQGGYAIVKLGDRYGVIDKNGDVVIPIIYNKIRSIKTYFFCGQTKDDYCNYLANDGIIKKIGHTSIYKVYDSYELAIILKSTKKLNDINDPINDKEHRLEYNIDIKAGVINLKGDEVVPCIYNAYNIDINSEGILISGVKYDFNGKQIITPFDPYKIKYDYGDFIVANEICTGKEGLLDKYGNKICDFIYDYVDNFCGCIALVTISGKQGIIDNSGYQVLPCLYTIKPFGNNKYDGKNNVSDTGYKIIYKDNKAGVLNSQGNIVVPCQYFSFKSHSYIDSIKIIKDKFFVVLNENNKEGLISIENPEMYYLECDFDEVKFFSNIEKKSNYYYDNKDYNIPTENGYLERYYVYIHGFGYDKDNIFSKYSKLDDFVFSNEEPYYKYILTFKDGFIQVINSETKVIVLPFSEEARHIEVILGDYVVYNHVCGDKDSFKIYSIYQRKRLPFEYDNIGYVGNKYLQVQSNGKWGLFDLKTGKEFLKCLYYEGINDFLNPINSKRVTITPLFMFINNDIAVINMKSKYGAININGEIIAECKYDRVDPFCEGMASVSINSSCGFINEKGKLIATNFDGSRNYSEGFAAVRKDGKWGYIDIEGNVVIPFIYEEAYDFKEGLAAVALEENKFGFINKDNKVIIPMVYYVVSNFHQGKANVMRGKEYGKILKDNSKLNWSKIFNGNYKNSYGDWIVDAAGTNDFETMQDVYWNLD